MLKLLLMRLSASYGKPTLMSRTAVDNGASSMLSEAVRVQARIKQLCEKAVYTYRCGHSLSLVVVTACKLPIIRNGLDTVKEVSRMFVKGSKQMTLLKEVVHQNPHFSRGQKVMFDVCVTRWVDYLDGFNMFLVAYPYIVETLEVIAHKLHLEKYPAWENWDQEFRVRVSGLLGAISTFQLCVVGTTVIRALTYLRGPSKKIQSQSLDLYDVVGQIKVVQGDLQHERENADESFFKRC